MEASPVKRHISAALAAAMILLSACSSGTHTMPIAIAGNPLARINSSGAGKIKHVVIIFQENRSFDNLFQGYPGADTASKGKNSLGQTMNSSR